MRDISRRVVLSETLRRIPSAFYPYELSNDTRSDMLSYSYYNDADADWLIYLTNGIVDPYYGWYLTEDQFDSFIISKYGSLEDPQQRIYYWTTNWSDTDFNVSVDYYQNLPDTLKKYWTPNYGVRSKIISYKRRQEDWSTNTNQIWTMETTGANLFSVADIVDISVNNVKTSSAEVVVANSTNMIIKNVYDEGITPISVETNGTSDTLYIGSRSNIMTDIKDVITFVDTITLTSRTNTAIQATASSITSLIANIPLSEQVYWEPVYYYDYERDVNESKKMVLLLNNNYLNDAVTALKEKLQE